MVIIFSFFVVNPIIAEDKNIQDSGFARMIPKLPKTPNDPELLNNFVYPSWGPVCQRYTYTVTYKDKEGRKPEYMRIIFNGKSIEMEPAFDKSTAGEESYKNGVRYEYKFVPNKLGSNFYYFEASNGLGKARAAIIDSPDNGPVLFDSAFDKNEIAVVDSKTGQKVLNFQTKEEWVGGIALSDDGKYLAAKTSNHIYLFDTQKPDKPLWKFQNGSEVGGDVKGGVAISGDGGKIFALIGSIAVLFDKNSNNPLWKTEVGNGYNVAISKDGRYTAVGLAGSEENENSNLLILWSAESEKPLWKYHSSGNFHDVSLSSDGSYIGASTGCPDRKAYIFSKDSNNPIFKSDQLTRDSPVHRGKISADGNYLAVGSESDAGAIFLFKKGEQQPVWKFPTQNGSSVRALNFTPDGKFIGAATFGGQTYIFESESSQPIASWTVDGALGGVDIADDGTFIATGGTDKKLHIFEKGKTSGVEIPFNEYVEEIDISANGKYIAAGTGGSVYFFESFNKDQNKIFSCTTVIEPKPLTEAMGGNNGQAQQVSSAGKSLIKNTQIKLPGMLFGFGFLGSMLLLGIFTAIRKLKFLEKQKKILMQFNLSKLSFLKLTGKKVMIFLLILTILFLFLTITAVLVNKNPSAVLLKKDEQNLPSDKQGSGVCGNNLCEPGLGETKESCPKDCSEGN
ncbi:hypothetical protein COT44_00745 [Candidatus Shapirobacteria bacterium CG08_land_8_20_14_0_20_39_18]|uniref:Anaphase-promoting complex subunit 4-like WD40 domain-containing protein n=1 Tax=Candidatus Shapirobacteria bacterium CG08_land_8_20_14_0_20_39_18 TaxID=1974883 RepID=A0A2M6XDY5_9BACT|nr:MAG: hypothetical protein COT44_00745 [Candidatus Shapirobacteria bacterium CG08_land_8_20_14_0_20_39_18]PJE68265.1 MAG: hypothetical protein COU94_02765 [Candidatus Shapirobacteria bacterium CG10_big_fil_rev_8_21_14_0_10_38_8]